MNDVVVDRFPFRANTGETLSQLKYDSSRKQRKHSSPDFVRVLKHLSMFYWPINVSTINQIQLILEPFIISCLSLSKIGRMLEQFWEPRKFSRVNMEL